MRSPSFQLFPLCFGQRNHSPAAQWPVVVSDAQGQQRKTLTQDTQEDDDTVQAVRKHRHLWAESLRSSECPDFPGLIMIGSD